MKKIRGLCVVISVVFALSVMLTACGTTEVVETPTVTPTMTETPVETTTATATPTPVVEVEELAKPAVLDLTKTYYFGDSLDNTDQKKGYEDYMTEEYGIDFSFHYPARNNYTEVINLAVAAADLDGLVQLFSGQQVREWKEDELIYPLTDFLADNEVFQETFPEAWKETFTFDGELWAIAQGKDNVASVMFARSIRGDWLDTLGLSRPETVWDLYEASYKFTYDDPDGNGLDDTFGMTSRTTWLMQDLFQAFDARLNYQGDAVPIWNPNTNIWEDSMLKPEMVECLELLNKMATENVMDKEAFVHSSTVAKNKVKSGYYGGFFYWDTWIPSTERAVQGIIPEAYMDGIYALKGNISVNINNYGIDAAGPPLAMTKTTPEPKETINWFVNVFFGSVEGVYRGKYGIQGDFIGEAMFTISGNTIYKNYYMKDDKITGYSAPGIVGGYPEYPLGAVYEISYNSPDTEWNEATTARVNNDLARRKAWFDEAAEWGGVYLLPTALQESQSMKYLEIKSDLVAASQEAIAKSMIGEISIEDALSQYRVTAKAMGAQEVIDKANEDIGQTSEQTY